MTSTTNQFLPDYAIHPGEYLEEVLLSRDIAKNDFAARCGIATKTVSQIIHGHASFSPEVAIQFERVLLHGKKRVFVDDEVEGDSEEEQEADRFARSRLVPKRAYSEFLAQGSFYAGEIAEFADRINVAPGIVVGMLQHDRKIEYSWHNGLKRKLDFEKTEESDT